MSSTKTYALIVIALLLIPRLSSTEPMMKPMENPTFSDACRSGSLVEAQYKSYEARSLWKPIGYFYGPLATFQVTRRVHGTPTPGEIKVIYEFQDGSACVEPTGWKFSDTLMPAKDSSWLLMLQPQPDGTFITYRGDFGRIPAGSPTASDILKKCADVWENKDK